MHPSCGPNSGEVEGFFEVFATTVIAFIFMRLNLIRPGLAAAAALLSATISLSGGIIGTCHYLYFFGTPTIALVWGSVFSALEVVPLVPIGTANDFAYTLAIPDDFDEAYALLREPNLIQLDLVEFETESQRAFFANVAAGGNSDRVTECLTDELKQNWGPLCYLRGAIGVLADLDTFHVRVQFDDEKPFEIDLWNVLIANGRTNAGRLEVAPDAQPDDGMLDVILIKDGTMIDLAALTVQFWTAAYAESDQVLYRKAKTFSVQADPMLQFSIDGESISEQPVTFRIKPAALTAIVGREYGNGTA